MAEHWFMEWFTAKKKEHNNATVINMGVNCADGFSMSVQASENHYCAPRERTGPWYEYEVGFPSAEEELLLKYAEQLEKPTKTVYGWVPVEIIEQVIEKHGGIK